MKYGIALALTLWAVPVSAQNADVGLARYATALREEAQILRFAGAVRSCNLRNAAWVNALLELIHEYTAEIHQQELQKISGDDRQQFERQAWLMQANTRVHTYEYVTRPRVSQLDCAEIRASRTITLMDNHLRQR